MSAQHTPGPWHIYIAPHGTRHILPCPSPTLGTVQICTFNGSAHRPGGETEANARLIAAAPKMLAALLHLDTCGQDAKWDRAVTLLPELFEALESAREAIHEAHDGPYIPTPEDLARKADEELDYFHGSTTSNPGREDFCRGT